MGEPTPDSQASEMHLFGLATELQDLIYACCGPEEVEVTLEPYRIVHGDGTEREDALVKAQDKADYDAIKSLRHTCRWIRERIERLTFPAEVAELTTVLVDCRQLPELEVAEYLDEASVPREGCLRDDLYHASSHVRFITPIKVADETEELKMGGDLTIDIRKGQDDDGETAWKVAGFDWNAYDDDSDEDMNDEDESEDDDDEDRRAAKVLNEFFENAVLDAIEKYAEAKIPEYFATGSLSSKALLETRNLFLHDEFDGRLSQDLLETRGWRMECWHW